MALRPSSLLLLLLVMIPAIAAGYLKNEEFLVDTQCKRDQWFCFECPEAQMKATTDLKRTFTDSKNDAIQQGGIVLDVHIDEEWIITFDYSFDFLWDSSCMNVIIIKEAATTDLKCDDIYYLRPLPKFGWRDGVSVLPWKYYKSNEMLQYKLKVQPGLYVADELGLFVNPEMKLGIRKNTQAGFTGIVNGYVNKDSSSFKPFLCKIGNNGQNDEAEKAIQVDNKFSCSGENTIFLEGTNTHAQNVYCGVGGWFGADKKMILEKYKNKESPFCVKDSMFEDCSKNKCFLFNPAGDTLVRVDDSNQARTKLGAYLVYDSDTTWRLQLQYKDIDLTSFTIGKEKFDVSGSVVTGQPNSKVEATIVKEGPKLISGYNGKIFKFEALKTESKKDLMWLFGFYSAGAVNEIQLDFGGKTFNADGVANYDKYVKTSNYQFGGAGASPSPLDVNNLFECKGDLRIYLDNARTGLTKLRFTKSKWLNVDGTPARNFEKDASGKDIIPAVNCYAVCKEASITLTGNPKPRKTTTSPADKLEYGCGGDFVKVDTKFYPSVICENDQWTGDGEVVALSAAFTFPAECYGFSTLKATCSDQEKGLGCAEATMTNGALTCQDGYALTILNSADPKKIYTSLKITRDGHLFDGQTDVGVVDTVHKAVCYSKCTQNNVKTDTPSADSEVAIYTYNANTNFGELKCTGNNLLVANLEGKEKSYGPLKCDKDGWKDGATMISKVFNGADSVNQLKVEATCFKACDKERLDIACATSDTQLNCKEPTYDATLKLVCPDTHVLFVHVNDKPVAVDKTLVCSSKGWTKDGDSELFIDYGATDRNKKIIARCYDKCGRKFVTGDAPFSGNKIECDGNKMISYIKDSDPAVDTLEEMICDKTGWKVGTDVITFAPGAANTIKAECKPSCNAQLVKDDCTTDLPYCEKALFKNDEWSCSEGHVLFSSELFEASEDPIKCQKKTLGNDKISIPRKTPTEQAAVSCFSICEEDFFEHKKDEIVKTLGEKGSFTMKCKDNLHHLGVSYGTDAPTFLPEFKCTTTGEIASVMKTHLGAKATVTCRNKCNNRIKEDSCGAGDTDCVKPPDAIANKLTCDDAHVMRIKTSVETKYISGNALECKTDGFYENTEKILSFKDDPNEDNEKFDIACISTCDSELALSQNAEITKNSNPKRNGDVVQCQDVAGQILHVTYGEATIRAFGPATCVKDIGWTGVNAKETPRGTADGNIVKFAGDKAQLKTQCLKVCDGAMVRDMKDEKDTNGNPLCPAVDLCTPIKHTLQDNTLQCDDNYRLFINDKNNDNTAVTVTREKTMVCTNEGWTEGTEKVVDFKDPDEDITKPVKAVCKNKCNPHFITFTNEEECPKETECSKPIYDPSSKTLKCSDTTEVLVLEYNGELKESFTEATCDKVNGWSNNKGDLFNTADNQAVGYNFHVKARCEQLCAFNVDKAALNAETETGLAYDRVAKTLTCNGTNEMLALNGVGVYSDLTCTKDGWITDAKIKDADGNPVKKIEFKPIIASNADATKEQRDERAKKFTCVPNDCLRSFKCKGHEYTKVGTDEDCINPDITKIKYEMSCTSPSKLTSPKTQGLSYDSLRCFDGAWKAADQSTLIDKLNPDSNELAKPVSERPAFDVFCNADACTGCKADDLAIIKSTTDANIAAYQFNEGTFTTCSNFRCSGADYLVEESGKNKYYRNTGANPIKCSSNKQETRKTFTAPDGKSIIGGKVGCVKKIPCNEHRPLQTDCQGLKSTCDSDAFQQRLKIGSLTSESEPVTCDTLGRMYYQKDAGKTGWKIVDKLLCTKTGDWSVTYHEVKDEKKEHVFGPETLPETMNLDSSKAGTNPRVICTVSDPNPEAKKQDSDPKTETCTFCPFPSALECNEDCKNAQDHATITNDGNGKCTMKIINGRFKINGGDEMDKGAELTCQMINGEYPWMTPDGKKINSLAVIMKGTDNISTGAIAGIVIGVILVLGLIVFAMVYMTIRKRKEIERQEKLKNKGLEQKQDSIIDGATIVDDSKTLVL